jgi:hypothetical protein
MGCLFRTTARAFRLGVAAVPRCSSAVQVEAPADSMAHERHLPPRSFRKGPEAS